MIGLVHILVFAYMFNMCVQMEQVRKVVVIHTAPETNSNYAPQTNWQIDKSSID